MKRTRALAALPVAVLFWFASGCGGGGDDPGAVAGSSTEATVKGVVTVDGKPVTGGGITFDPSNTYRSGEKSRTSQIDADGSFTVVTLIGENKVTVSGPGIPSYTNSFEVIPGENQIPIDVPKPDGKAKRTKSYISPE